MGRGEGRVECNYPVAILAKGLLELNLLFVIVGDCVGERKGLPPRGGGVKLSGSEAKPGVGGARSMSDSGKSGSGLQS
jgi:hypothetical protein